jgi:integrase
MLRLARMTHSEVTPIIAAATRMFGDWSIAATDQSKALDYPWLRVRDLRPAFAIEASQQGASMHFIQSALGHGSAAITEEYYARFDPKSAAKQLLRVIDGGRRRKDQPTLEPQVIAGSTVSDC